MSKKPSISDLPVVDVAISSNTLTKVSFGYFCHTDIVAARG